MQLPTQNKLESMSKEEFDSFLVDIEGSIDLLSEEQLQDLQGMISKVEDLSDIEKARTDFATFVRVCGPKYLVFSSRGQHHMMAKKFEDVLDGRLDRVTISLSPRWGKSEFGSILLPAWFIGRFPDQKIMQASAKESLATDFGRKVKAIIESPMYKKVFPGVSISKDSRASGKFATNQGGIYMAIGAGAGAAGFGANLLVIDDATNEIQALSGDPSIYDNIWEWFQLIQQRLQADGRIVIIQTRWSKADLIGRIKARSKEDPDADKYDSIEFPALDENGESNFPEIWPTDKIIRRKNGMTPYRWNAQYLQNPTIESGAIVSRSMWKKWDQYKKIPNSNDVEFVPPSCNFVLMVMDTAYTNNKRSDPTAITVWGGFKRTNPEGGEDVDCIILLWCHKKKMEFPELKRQAKEWIKQWEPDTVLIEAKSSGPMLISELNQAGIPAVGVTPKPQEDKVSRLNSVTSMFISGRVWYMPTFANEACIEEVNDFPNGLEDHMTDCTAYAVRHFRQSGLVGASDDKKWEPDPLAGMRGSYYA